MKPTISFFITRRGAVDQSSDIEPSLPINSTNVFHWKDSSKVEESPSHHHRNNFLGEAQFTNQIPSQSLLEMEEAADESCFGPVFPSHIDKGSFKVNTNDERIEESAKIIIQHEECNVVTSFGLPGHQNPVTRNEGQCNSVPNHPNHALIKRPWAAAEGTINLRLHLRY